MIINHDKKFVFIHIPKCGGNSVLRPLFNTLTPNKSIVTHQDLVDDLGSYKWNFDHNHASYPMDDLNSFQQMGYFVFSFTRNSYDRAVSLYYWRRVLMQRSNDQYSNREYYLSFVDFLDLLIKYGCDVPYVGFLSLPQTFWLMEKDQIIVDYVGKIEEYVKSMQYICKILDISPISWRQINKNTMRKNEHYSMLYNDKSYILASEYYKKDIKVFGHEFKDKKG